MSFFVGIFCNLYPFLYQGENKWINYRVIMVLKLFLNKFKYNYKIKAIYLDFDEIHSLLIMTSLN